MTRGLPVADPVPNVIRDSAEKRYGRSGSGWELKQKVSRLEPEPDRTVQEARQVVREEAKQASAAINIVPARPPPEVRRVVAPAKPRRPIDSDQKLPSAPRPGERARPPREDPDKFVGIDDSISSGAARSINFKESPRPQAIVMGGHMPSLLQG